jgi:hypothetical protein
MTYYFLQTRVTQMTSSYCGTETLNKMCSAESLHTEECLSYAQHYQALIRSMVIHHN